MFSRQTFLKTWFFKQLLIFFILLNNFKCFEKEHFLGSFEQFLKSVNILKNVNFLKAKTNWNTLYLKKHTVSAVKKNDWWCPHHEAWSWESRRHVLRWRLLQLSTIIGWKRSGVSVFSGIYRGSNSFASIAKRLWWPHQSEDSSAQSLGWVCMYVCECLRFVLCFSKKDSLLAFVCYNLICHALHPKK